MVCSVSLSGLQSLNLCFPSRSAQGRRPGPRLPQVHLAGGAGALPSESSWPRPVGWGEVGLNEELEQLGL